MREVAGEHIEGRRSDLGGRLDLPPRERREQRHDWILYGAAAASSAVVAVQFPVLPFLRVVQEAAQFTWLGAGVMLVCMAGALLAEPLRRML